MQLPTTCVIVTLPSRRCPVGSHCCFRPVFDQITALFDQDAVTGHSAPEAAGKLASFVTRVVLAGSIPPPILLAALVYLSRLKARYPLSTGASGARLFLTALVLGQKILQDGPYSNWTWVRLVRGHYSLSELACMERELLAFLAWDVAVEVDQLLAVEVNFVDVFGPCKRLSLTKPFCPLFAGPRHDLLSLRAAAGPSDVSQPRQAVKRLLSFRHDFDILGPCAR